MFSSVSNPDLYKIILGFISEAHLKYSLGSTILATLRIMMLVVSVSLDSV